MTVTLAPRSITVIEFDADAVPPSLAYAVAVTVYVALLPLVLGAVNVTLPLPPLIVAEEPLIDTVMWSIPLSSDAEADTLNVPRS